MRPNPVFAASVLLLALLLVGPTLLPALGRANAKAVEDNGSQPELVEPVSSPAESSTTDAASEDRELSPRLLALRDRLRQVLAHHAPRRLNTSRHTAWEVMHWVIAHGVEAEVVDTAGGEPQNAIGWLCFNRPVRGDRILTLENGRPMGVIGVGLQGHHGQLLAVLAQAHLRRDYPMYISGQTFKVEDLLENEKLTCRSGMELTFKLIAAAHYLSTDTTWKNEAGQDWSVARLVREELGAPIQGAACGGTHRLMALSHAVRKRQKEGHPLKGEFARAQKYLRDYHRYAFRLQNPDGSFSTQWLEYREARPDLDRRLQTSGHILEWLAYSLGEEELQGPEMVQAVEYLTELLARRPERKWEIGPLSHGLHGLALYDQRVFRPLETTPAASKPQELPPAREPQLSEEWRGERSILVQRWTLLQAQRSVAPVAPAPPAAPALTPRIVPPANGPEQDGASTPHVSSDTGPLLISPRGVLK